LREKNEREFEKKNEIEGTKFALYMCLVFL